MSSRNSKSKPKAPAAEPGIYDGLLIVSTTALIAGIIFLMLHLNNYGWEVVG